MVARTAQKYLNICSLHFAYICEPRKAYRGPSPIAVQTHLVTGVRHHAIALTRSASTDRQFRRMVRRLGSPKPQDRGVESPFGRADDAARCTVKIARYAAAAP